MSDWTLGAVKASNMEIVALCEAKGCRHMFVFDLDALIAGIGPDYALDDIPQMDCPRCGVSPLTIRLSFADPRRRRKRIRAQFPSPLVGEAGRMLPQRRESAMPP